VKEVEESRPVPDCVQCGHESGTIDAVGVMTKVANETDPFEVETDGMSIFTGPSQYSIFRSDFLGRRCSRGHLREAPIASCPTHRCPKEYVNGRHSWPGTQF
jgi:hypothetical protein